jgi:hypothetical protein
VITFRIVLTVAVFDIVHFVGRSAVAVSMYV